MEVLQDPWMRQRVDTMITHVYPMSKAAVAFETIIDKQACKVHPAAGMMNLITSALSTKSTPRRNSRYNQFPDDPELVRSSQC